jgi:phospholipase C
MPALKDRVSTVVLLAMENRSFDHMLGHLSLEGLLPGVDGLSAPLSRFQNFYSGDAYLPFWMNDHLLDSDLPHETDEIQVQLARSQVTQRLTMTGFVEAYARFRNRTNVGPFPDPMGYFPSHQVPVTSFLARTFKTCDRWFSPLPSSTQPNRCMAWCGGSQIHDTKARLIPTDSTLLDWLDGAGVRWRVYHDGLSFFALYPKAWKQVLGDGFRDYEFFFHDLSSAPAAGDPQVIIVEPSYQDGPHFGSDRPNDNHAPLAVGWGEEFLRRTYEAVRANPDRWASTVLVLYYDEHGGFFDHVAPPSISYATREDRPHAFTSAGPRVPAVVVSPLVSRGAVCSAQLDHTSILQLLAELFTPGQDYNADVRARRLQGIASLSVALEDVQRTDAPPPPSQAIPVTTVLGRSLAAPPGSGMQAAFEDAAQALIQQEPALTAKKYPELFQWKAAVEAARGQKP